MRVVDILCVVVVTKLLVTSDASSTPADYSTHSLISDGTHDAVRALRVGDESDIQEERTLPFVDPVLSYIPGTAAHDAAKVARVENKLALKYLNEIELSEFFGLLQTTDSKWTQFAYLLSKNVEPKHLRLFLTKYGKSDNEIESIVVPYTALYENRDLNKSKKGINSDIEKTAESFRAEETVLKAIKISKERVGDWVKQLLNAESNRDQFELLLLRHVLPGDFKKMLKKNGMKENDYTSLVDSYTAMFLSKYE